MRSRLNKLREIHSRVSSELEVIKFNNERADYLKSELSSLNDYIEFTYNYRDALIKILAVTKEDYKEYQENRIAFIENSLEDNINVLFPNQSFIPKISYENERNSIKSSLLLIDDGGNPRYPRITEGGFMKELIAFTSSINVLELVGSKTFYLDEAFSKASSLNKEKMGPIINGYIKRGIQMILISQSSECYQDIERREFRLLNETGKLAKLVSVEDFSGVE